VRQRARSLSTSISSDLLIEFGSRGNLVAPSLTRPPRGSGVQTHPPADRLARLQRLYGGDQADEGVHRLPRPPKIKGNLDSELAVVHGARPSTWIRSGCFPGWRFHLTGRAIQRRGVGNSGSTIQTQPAMSATDAAAGGVFIELFAPQGRLSPRSGGSGRHGVRVNKAVLSLPRPVLASAAEWQCINS